MNAIPAHVLAAIPIVATIIVIAAGVGLLVISVLGLVRWLVRRAGAQLQAHADATGQAIIRGPEYGSFRGAERMHGRVKCDGALAATDKTLLLQKAIGGRIEVEFADVTGVTPEKAFMGNWRAGQPVVVLRTRDDNRIGFFMQDTDAWIALIREHMTHSE